MGCAASRNDGNGGGLQLQVRSRPAFLRRLEDMNKRRQTQSLEGNKTLSKKELLLHDKEDDEIASGHEPVYNNARKSSCSPDDIACYITSEGPGKPVKEVSGKEGCEIRGDVIETSKNANSKEEGFTGKGNADEEQERKTKIMAKKRSKVEGTNERDAEFPEEEEDDEDDDERMLKHRSSLEFPGSPSFRGYIINNMVDDKSDNEGLDDGPAEMVPIEDSKLPQEPVIIEAKREKKRRSFKMVLPKGGQSAVKNLLNVRSCMSSTASQHDRNHLLTAKTPA